MTFSHINWRALRKWGVAAILLNELRGLIVVALTWRLWWPLVAHAWALALQR